jgi:release factor glutamine methyltransferase
VTEVHRIAGEQPAAAADRATDSGVAIVDRLRAAGCVFAEDEARLLTAHAATPDDLDALVARRVAGEPLEQILGWAEFGGQHIAVEPGVFVPRRRSELLARQAIARARDGAVVVDLCCGSGAIGAVVLAARARIELHATDIDAAAARNARHNLPDAATVYVGDLDEPLPRRLRGRVDVLVANTPYVPTGEIELMPPEARVHEPREALDGGPDGLDIARRVIAAAPRWLAPGGSVLVETSERQATILADAVGGQGLAPGIVHSDDIDATVVIGTKRL